MGHKDDKTTWKYLRYLRKEKANQNAIVMLDQILEEAML
ncbi:site-specific integrase, partial [Vibrio anguillarum]|nr:site-specific integrase [Vibrio anguillarum]